MNPINMLLIAFAVAGMRVEPTDVQNNYNHLTAWVEYKSMDKAEETASAFEKRTGVPVVVCVKW